MKHKNKWKVNFYYADLEFIKNNSKVLYKTTATEIGVGATDKINEKKHGINGLFTNVYNNDLFQHLITSGMYKFNGLNTVRDKERVINGSKDWMLNLV